MSAGSKDKDDDLGDVYELLGVDYDAGDKEITTAYRKGSLQCHPDRNPDDPEAAIKFDRLTRAKDLLLDPQKRAVLDEKRKAKEALEKRFAQEDAKRRKLREDLEGRENAAARAGPRTLDPQESPLELRRRQVKADYAERVRERQAEIASRQASAVAAARATGRSSETTETPDFDAEETPVTLSWREEMPISEASIREVLEKFRLRSLDMEAGGAGTAIAHLASREDALRAVLHWRERKNSMPFRIALAAAPGSTAAKSSSDGRPHAVEQTVPKGPRFSNWEKDMLAALSRLAHAQKQRRGETGVGARTTWTAPQVMVG
eukprot:TRINITY_DN8675_c0_g1_i1.p1 TRINITY_DN8675_c0_g1~~TRINITY_DN8675_c0_g1_i1.p1  ORF type:complete len:319 (-),score=63.33 TRINITY_DN8675_c0_g1_i1:10-966(-)